MSTDPRDKFRDSQPAGDGHGLLRVDADQYVLSEAGLELYHCDEDVADWNLFAFADRTHGAYEDAIGVAFHGVLPDPPATREALVGADLMVASDNEGWESDFVIDGAAGDLSPPSEGCSLRVLSIDGARVRLELRGGTFTFMTADGEVERNDVAVRLDVEATVIGM
jgi:hypothetical protein